MDPASLPFAILVAIDPKNLCTVLVSPRQRAHRTFELLFEHLDDSPEYRLTEEVREWDYGYLIKYPRYLSRIDAGCRRLRRPSVIRNQREKSNLDDMEGRVGDFYFRFIFPPLIRYRCPNGESVQDMQDRVDGVISKVQSAFASIELQLTPHLLRFGNTINNTRSRGSTHAMFSSWHMATLVASLSPVGSRFPFALVRAPGFPALGSIF